MPSFLKSRRNRYLLDSVARRYNKSPSDYLLNDDPISTLVWEIDRECADLGTEVDNLLELRITKEQGKKTVQEPRFSLTELLDDDFTVPDDLIDRSRRGRYRDPRQAITDRSVDIVSHDAFDPEDLV